jgi:Icc-related predicted phosphoesterase
VTVRIAAAGDLHVGVESAGTIRPHFEHLGEQADVLLLAGDLTRRGRPEEAEVLADELAGLPVPMLAVLGNHDHDSDRTDLLVKRLDGVGVRVLEGDTVVLDAGGARLGVAGVKGFGGGFAGASGSEFGEPEMKAFMAHTRQVSDRLEAGLADLKGGADLRVALLHYSPVPGTLQGERLEVYPFLGSYLLAEAIDRPGADLVVHGHAHGGSERGATPGGVPVRNVAQPVLRRAYAVYCLGEGEMGSLGETPN